MKNKQQETDASISPFTPISELMLDAYNDIENRYSSPVNSTGMITGFDPLDQLIDGLHRGELIVIGGRTSMGKTALAMNLSSYPAISKSACAVCQLCMSQSVNETALRMLSAIAGVNINSILRGKLKAKDWRRMAVASGMLAESNIQVLDSIGSLDEIYVACQQLKQTDQGLDLVVLDDLQSLASQIGLKQNNQNIAKALQCLKQMAKALDVAVVLTSALKPSLETRFDKRPIISDLYHATIIEQTADVIMLLYRDEIYHPKPDNEGIADIIVVKQHHGSLAATKLLFEGKYCRFSNLEPYSNIALGESDSELEDAYQRRDEAEFEDAINSHIQKI